MEYLEERSAIKKSIPTCEPAEHAHATPRQPPLGPERLERAARLLRALGDAPRLRLLQLLTRGEWCVTELVAALEEKFSTVSQRLRVLRNEGLVTRRRAGTHLFYALADRHVADLMHNALEHAQELEGAAAPRTAPFNKKGTHP